MNTTPSSTPSSSSTALHGRALVLAGAGSTGNAWEIGLVAGLSEAGVDLTEADVIIGTSAGSTVAAQITSGRRPAELFADILAAPPLARRGDAGPERGRAPNQATQAYLEWSDRIIASAADASDMRRKMGAAALETDGSDVRGGARWRDIVAARLPSRDWPAQRVLITAVDARTGEPVVFDRHSGVELVDAVAASTSNGFRPFGAYRIGEDRYVNGGYRRSENADLAAGYARVLVLSPFGGRSRMPQEWGMDLATQVEELRTGGSRVETIVPEVEAEHLFGAAAMDVSLRPAAARAGHDQGRALAERLAEFWR
ncbi:patatin-like phospholipase family protein [Nocardioides pocheonensis]|uniref:Patatin-like phospholipase family protein n=1 Tax=Nocardioides pocheonensis TaxID=661485 RepID=A0A3N0GHK1_9ACTN|nr:patatin-like phospholipase family protein [Nocardioides pocheonensis]RNM11622.1 patatin-like phospholipase family protein [Nocardioides pocheonensis]